MVRIEHNGEVFEIYDSKLEGVFEECESLKKSMAASKVLFKRLLRALVDYSHAETAEEAEEPWKRVVGAVDEMRKVLK
jgi:hypothetical protein